MPIETPSVGKEIVLFDIPVLLSQEEIKSIEKGSEGPIPKNIMKCIMALWFNAKRSTPNPSDKARVILDKNNAIECVRECNSVISKQSPILRMPHTTVAKKNLETKKHYTEQVVAIKAALEKELK